jgi:uncharacterized protein YndB with AHSA1/START domain
MADDDLDPVLDLRLERVVPVEAAALWRGWTEPARLVQWFTPAPWVTTEAEVDLRPGGTFRTVMRGPDGETGETAAGCVLEVVPQRRFVWTSSLGPGFRPVERVEGALPLTAVIEFEPVDGGTRYRATARHGSEADARLHAEMGFAVGWGAAFDQLVALVG